MDCVSKINTGGKYDSKAFKKSVGLNGVGTKAVNALSDRFKVVAYREGKSKLAEFEKGILVPMIPELGKPKKRMEHSLSLSQTYLFSKNINSDLNLLRLNCGTMHF